MTVPPFATTVLQSRESGATYEDPEWWLAYTPLNLAVSGRAAVLAFFVLSGIVLTLPVLEATTFDWLAYCPRRLLRLYLPVVAAIAFAAVTFLVVRRHLDPSQGPWMTRAPETYPLLDALRDTLIVGWVSGAISPLWTLFYEVWFS